MPCSVRVKRPAAGQCRYKMPCINLQRQCKRANCELCEVKRQFPKDSKATSRAAPVDQLISHSYSGPSPSQPRDLCLARKDSLGPTTVSLHSHPSSLISRPSGPKFCFQPRWCVGYHVKSPARRDILTHGPNTRSTNSLTAYSSWKQ